MEKNPCWATKSIKKVAKKLKEVSRGWTEVNEGKSK